MRGAPKGTTQAAIPIEISTPTVAGRAGRAAGEQSGSAAGGAGDRSIISRALPSVKVRSPEGLEFGPEGLEFGPKRLEFGQKGPLRGCFRGHFRRGARSAAQRARVRGGAKAPAPRTAVAHRPAETSRVTATIRP